MSNEVEFVSGLIVKAPNENAPEYVKAKISIKRAELAGWLATKSDEWINVDVKVSQGGKWYAAVDSWKPQGGNARNTAPQPPRRQPEPQFDDAGFGDQDIPFASNRSRF